MTACCWQSAFSTETLASETTAGMLLCCHGSFVTADAAAGEQGRKERAAMTAKRWPDSVDGAEDDHDGRP